MNAPLIRNCSKCLRPTRPSRSPVSEYPGTSQRHGDQCTACHRAALRLSGNNPAPRQPIEHTLAGLESFLARRRQREAANQRSAS